MTDTTASPELARPQPRKLSGRAKAGIVIGAVLCLVAGAGGGYFIGRSTTEKGTDTAGCAATKKAVRDMHEEFTQAGAGSVEAASITRTQLNMVVQNPDCFPARVRGEAQTALDQAASAQQAAEARSQCAAAGGRWWECNTQTTAP